MKPFIALVTYFFPLFLICHLLRSEDNNTKEHKGVIRVIEPGVFDYQSSDFLVRMGLWGVNFPNKDQAGFMQAINFCEEKLLNSVVEIKVRKEFNSNNIKLVEVYPANSNESLNLMCIRGGLGWHKEEETSRHGPYVLAQIRAKRSELGIWANGFNYGNTNQIPLKPVLPGILGNSPIFSGLKYWVTSFGKVHRPECSFYQRGRGELTNRPRGDDCRICGGFKGKN